MTKRSHGDGGIDPRGQDVWRLRYRANGKRHAKTVHGSLSDARKELRRLLKSADDGAHIAPNKITLAQWASQWLALLERKPEVEKAPKAKSRKRRKRGRVSARTLERYSDLMRLHVVPTLGARPLQKITASEIDALYIEREQVLAPRTVHHVHVALKACLAVAVRKKLRIDNPADDTEPPTFVDGDAGMMLDQDQLTALVRGFKGRALYATVAVAAFTGARSNEILALQWSDINFEAKTLTIMRAIEPTKKYGRRTKEPKTERGRRTITIDDELIAILSKRREMHLRLVAGVPDGAEVDTSLVKLPDGALIFPGGDGTDLTRLRNYKCVYNDFLERARKLGFKGLRFHDLRGIHGTLLLGAGVPVHVVAARIGDDPATLLRTYAKRTKKADTSAAAVITALATSVLAGTP